MEATVQRNQQLVRLRVARGMSVWKAAREIGIDDRVLRRLEDGGRSRMATRKKVADFYNVDILVLFPDLWDDEG